MSRNLTYFLVFQYMIILGFSISEHNWGQSFYWLGAIILTIGILVMNK